MGTGVDVVTKVTKSMSEVRYVITSDDNLVVNGVVAPVYSTSANSLETLPFRLLHKVAPGALQWEPIAAALEVILESPVLRAVESLVNAVAGMKAPKAFVPAARVLAAPHVFIETWVAFYLMHDLCMSCCYLLCTVRCSS